MIDLQNATYQEFIVFIMAQPADKDINHTVGWCGCAVGEYLSTVTTIPKDFNPDGRDSNEDYDAIGNWVSIKICENNHDLGFGLSNAGFANRHYPTYGHLQQWLKENDHV